MSEAWPIHVTGASLTVHLARTDWDVSLCGRELVAYALGSEPNCGLCLRHKARLKLRDYRDAEGGVNE